ncbi:hypothetical protein ABIE93_006906 [Bradyrhizobium elkanii]
MRPRTVLLLWRSWIGPKIEFKFTLYLDDALWMTAVLEESISQRLGAADKKTTKGTPAFAGNPIAGTISANENNPWG